MSDRPSPQPVRVIQELFQDYNDIGYKQALSELDSALDEGAQYIVIEPMRLGDETQRWITVGNFLHKSTVLAGSACLVGVICAPKHWWLWSPLMVSTTGTFAAYTLCWQADPCCKYQVETRQETLASLDIGQLNTHSVVVLTRRDDQRRRLLHTVVFSMAAAAVAYRIYLTTTEGS